LLDTAEQRASAGHLDSAAATLERALRLEPQNPLLWHRLARLRLQQGQFALPRPEKSWVILLQRRPPESGRRPCNSIGEYSPACHMLQVALALEFL
jgi:hypothetical protein